MIGTIRKYKIDFWYIYTNHEVSTSKLFNSINFRLYLYTYTYNKITLIKFNTINDEVLIQFLGSRKVLTNEKPLVLTIFEEQKIYIIYPIDGFPLAT